MSGFLDSIGSTLKSALYNDDPSAEPKAVVAPSATVQTQVPVGGQLLTPGAQVNPEFVAAIKKATFSRNTAFTQVLNAAESLSDVIPDPVMRLKAAYKTAGQGRTGKQIADAVDVHLQDVDGEEMRFKAMIDQKSATEVAGLEAQASSCTAQITSAQGEIARAQERIQTLTASITDLTTAAAQANAGVQAKKNELADASAQFKIAAQAVRNELNVNKSAILSTLV